MMCHYIFPGGSVVKNLPVSAGDVGDIYSIPGSVRFPGGGSGNPLGIPAWKIPWAEEPGGPQSLGVIKELDTIEHVYTCMNSIMEQQNLY